MTTLRRATSLGAVVAAAWLFGSCGGGSMQLDPSYVAVHNTMTAMGLAQSGEIYEGTLREGEVERVTAPLRAGDCYTLVAFGGAGVGDLDLSVRDNTGAEVASDRTSDSRAAAQLCPTADGEYEVAIQMTHGSGSFVLTSWSGAPVGGLGARAGGGRGTCASPLPLAMGEPVTGNTTQGTHQMSGTCVRPPGEAPEQVYALRLEQRAQVVVELNSEFDGMLYILGTCGNSDSQIACNDDEPRGNTSRSRVEATLDAGTYFVVVDGYGNASGAYTLTASVQELQSLAQVCGAAQPLTPGRAVTASTQGQANYFTATCAGGARSPDRVYTLDVPQRSRVRVRMQSTYDGAIYLRQSCVDPNSELACNDDHQDTRHSMLQTTLAPGRYYVYADGFASNNQGDYSLRADVAPLGGNTAANRCTAPGTAQPGRDVEVDTFPATDDFAGSCGGQGAPDLVYRLDVQQRSRLRAQVISSEFDTAIYLRSTCDQASSEMVCASGSSGQGPISLEANLQPGTYFLVVDGTQADVTGAARVELQLDNLQALETACQQAPQLRPGRTIQGDTSSSQDRFQATCAGNARSADLVYRLVLARRSRVRITSEQQYDGALYIRRDCTDVATEVACNDDHPPGDNRHSLLETTLDAGTYYVFVDGFADRSQGAFTMDVVVNRP